MKFENTEVWGFEHAIRGARNPMNSWDKSDSGICKGGDSGIGCKNCAAKETCSHQFNYTFQIGKNDMKLLQKLVSAGTDHRKFMRQIIVSVDISAPLYWWKEYSTYKVGTVENSCSTMHTLSSSPITMDCFEKCNYNPELGNYEWQINDLHNSVRSGGRVGDDVEIIIDFLENLRQTYLETNEKKYWYELIRWLPESWLQKRTVTMNYENLRNIYFARRNHKLDEWSKYFIGWIESLPFAADLIMYERKDEA